jgi:hypothetical protein
VDNAGVMRFDEKHGLVLQGRDPQQPVGAGSLRRCPHGHRGRQPRSLRHRHGRRASVQHRRVLLRRSPPRGAAPDRACCIPCASSRACAPASSTAATRAASPRSTARWCSTTATSASRWCTAAPAASSRSRSTTSPVPENVQAGDLIVMTGGRIGKDGIHGATFSSVELHEGARHGGPDRRPHHPEAHVRLPAQGPGRRPLQRAHRQRRRRALVLGGRDGHLLGRRRHRPGPGPAEVRRPGGRGRSWSPRPGAHDRGAEAPDLLGPGGRYGRGGHGLGAFTDSGSSA